MQIPTAKEAVERILADRHSSEIEELAESLPFDNNRAVKRFCGQFDYLSDNPGWLMSALQESPSCLADILSDIAFDKRLEERQAQIFEEEAMSDLRRAQGLTN